jgi:hypothetical protein
MKKVRIFFAATACTIAVGAAVASNNPFVATKVFVVNPTTGVVTSPPVVVAPNYLCVESQVFCTREYNVNASGAPTTPAALPVQGVYTPL